MKKMLFTSALALSAFVASAQFEQGSIITTGTLGFETGSVASETKVGNNTTNSDGPTSQSFTFAARGGYFIADNLAIGLGLGYNSVSGKSVLGNTTNEQTSGITNILLFTRYYVPYSESFAVFAELGFESGFGKNTNSTTTGNTTNSTEQGVSSFGVGISPGFTYFLHKNIALDLNYGFLGYTSASIKTENPNGDYNKVTSSSTGLNLDLSSIRLGISVFF
jgi:outer membrane immunogenic protein